MRIYIGPANMEAHRWFAWRPVWVDESHTIVWLEHVIRRRTSEYDGERTEYSWYYRLAPKQATG